MLRARLGLFIGLTTGLAASQIPEYAQQYRQRLGGAIDELQTIVSAFDADSARYGLTQREGVARLLSSEDAFVRGRGDQMEEIVVRLAKLARANQKMAQSGPVGRLAALAQNFDPQIGARAYESFEPAVPVTGEGFALGGLGFLAGYSLWSILTAPFGRGKRRAPARA
ncbi:DUF2937 family protein [Methylocella sp.]|uniref:DUF2937 family protein n=1 Tax=Methylocella sp. TaxID=1978226 RepID=UPI00378457C7